MICVISAMHLNEKLPDPRINYLKDFLWSLVDKRIFRFKRKRKNCQEIAVPSSQMPWKPGISTGKRHVELLKSNWLVIYEFNEHPTRIAPDKGWWHHSPRSNPYHPMQNSWLKWMNARLQFDFITSPACVCNISHTLNSRRHEIKWKKKKKQKSR